MKIVIASFLCFFLIMLSQGINLHADASQQKNKSNWTYWDVQKTKPRNVEIYDSEGKQNGEWETWYNNGNLKSKTSFHHGEILLTESWYENGEKRLQEPFAEGIPHGLCSWWSPEGKLLAKSYFDHGTGVEYYFSDDGTEKKRVFWLSGVQVPAAKASTEPSK